MRNKALIAAVSSMAVLSGCASDMSDSSSQVSDLERQLTRTQSELAAARAQTAAAQAAAAAASSQQQASAPLSQPAPMGDMLPPGAKAGECYARVWVEPTYRSLTKKMLAKEASERVEVIPARYEMAEERVLVKAASSRIEQIPAVYKTESETILVKESELVWRTDLARNAAPASSDLLAAAKRGGINLAGATPGMCFHEHYRPAQYETMTKQVEIAPEQTVASSSDAQYRWVEKRVLVKEASTKLVDVAAVYKTETEQVVDVPAHTVWKKGTGPIQRIDAATGEIMCLVDVPATYKTVSKRVLVSPASTKTIELPAEYKTIKVRELVADASQSTKTIPAKFQTVTSTKKTADAEFVWHEISDTTHPATTRTGNQVCLTETPAQYKTVKRQVVASPASSRTIEIPAEYKTVSVRKLVAPASEKRIAIPAEYKTVATKELEKDGFMEWRSILCKTNATNDLIRSLQSALDSKGYNPGVIDGVIGTDTIRAVNAYQADHKLPVGPYLNIETLKHIGVI